VNGEAIYGTRPWRLFGEGPTKVAEGSFHDTDVQPYTPEDFRFTTKAGILYAIELGWPAKGEVVIRSLGSSAGQDKVQSVELLGSDAKLSFQQGADGLHISVLTGVPGKYAFTYRIQFATAR
jgi:alpha-L-fucosidase